ncbi:MAG TPA: hypothetical protein VHL34_03620 [Rhizomicrobium sp.]|jgi:hypothetical protein|nr:hypothetical protein [Rhizomicrobium sp.]
MREFGEAGAIEPGGDTTWGLVAATVVAVAASATFLFYVMPTFAPMMWSGAAPFAMSALISSGAAIAVLVWAALYFSYVRDRAPELGITYFMVLLVAASVLDYGAIGLSYTHRPAMVASMAPTPIANYEDPGQEDDTVMFARVDVRSAVGIVLSPTGGSATLHTDAPGDGAVVAGLARDLIEKSTEQHLAFQRAFAATGLNRPTQPSQFGNDIAGMRARIKRGRALLAKARADDTALLANFRKNIAAAKIDATLKTELYADIDHSIEVFAPARDRVMGREDAALAELAAMMAELAHPRGPWALRGNTILFSSDYDLASYRAHVRKIAALSAQPTPGVVNPNGGPITPPQHISF